MSDTRQIYCCECSSMVEARLTTGREIYPHRNDLWTLKFWKCDNCGNYVGCHKNHQKESKRLEPLGTIPTDEIRRLRTQIHYLLDPLWRQGIYQRTWLYKKLSQVTGIKTYHTGGLNSVNDCNKIINYLVDLRAWATKNKGFKV